MSTNNTRFANAIRQRSFRLHGRNRGVSAEQPFETSARNNAGSPAGSSVKSNAENRAKNKSRRRVTTSTKGRKSYRRSNKPSRRQPFRYSDRFSDKYKLSLLKCPACLNAFLTKSANQIICTRCGKHYDVINGMPNLAPDLSITTKLEHIDYNSIHSIGVKQRDAVYSKWEKVLNRIDVKGGHALEIGSGTGQLTDGLLNRYDFESVHATDISATFLKSTEKEFVRETSNRSYFYLCDANELPFRSNSFDVVLGHSVLHHFLNYEKTLKACSKVLKPGGKAVFFEPVIQGKIMVAMLLQMIVETQEHTIKVFTDEEVMKIRRIIHHITKAKFIGDDKKKLAVMEDKYIFDPIRLMGRLPEFGFSNIRIEKVGMLHKNYRLYVAENLRIAGVNPEKLKYFQYLFRSFGNTTGALLNHSTLFPPMVFLVFEK